MPLLKDDQKGMSILSLDAGSPGGVISQLHVLVDFMKLLGTQLNVEGDLLPSDHFDLIGGSGLAAFVALCIGPLKMSAVDALEFMKVLGISVFYEHHGQPNETIFDSTELRENLRTIIEGAGYSPDAMIGTLDAKSHSKSVFFVSPVVDISSCHRLRTYRSRKGMLQCTILEVALASISTLGLFDYAEIGSSRRKYTSVGMHHTNPIKDVLDEAEQIFGKEQRVTCILSLGSGTGSNVITPSNLAHLEVHGLLQAMEMQQRVVSEEVGHRYSGLEAYYWFSVNGVGSGSLSDWTHWDADIVESLSRDYLDIPEHSKDLAAAAQQLKDGRGTVTLDSLNHASGTAVIAKAAPPVTPFFVLRKKAWAFIEKNLANSPMDKQLIFLLTGLGGCGKTTLFSHYTQVYGSKYSHIFLLDASSVHSIKYDLQNAVRSLGPEHSQKTWEEALHYFEQEGPNKNWLIGFDSADDPSLPLHEFIPKSDHGTVFITSRNRDLFLLTTPELQWELGPMTQEEALDALLRSAQRDISPSEADLKDGYDLVDRLGGLALAVVQAGVYCFQRCRSIDADKAEFSFHQYLNEMDRNHGDLMRFSASQSLDGYDKSVYQSLNMSYSALPQLTREFLHLCGYFHRSAIPLLMLESAVDNHFQQNKVIIPEISPLIEKKLGDVLESRGRSTTIHLHKIIFSLKMFSLVVTSITPKSIMLNYHALVNTWSRDILSLTQQQQYFAMATRVVSTCGDDKYYLVHDLLLPHTREILKRPDDLHLNDMHLFAAGLVEAGMAGEAEALYRRVYEKCARVFGRNHGITLAVLSNLTNSVRDQGRYEEAAQMGRDVLGGQRNIYSEDDDKIFMTENNLGISYLFQERWDEAEAILLKTLAVGKKQFGTEDPRTLKTMSNLAVAYLGQNRNQEAMELEEEVLESKGRVLGKDHPDTLTSMTNLGKSYKRLNRPDDAQRLEEEALKIRKDTNGKDHPGTLMAMSNLANTYRIQGRLINAVTLGEQALDGRRRVLGKKHPETLQTMGLVSEIYFRLDRISEGIQLQKELYELEGGMGQWSRGLIAFLKWQYKRPV